MKRNLIYRDRRIFRLRSRDILGIMKIPVFLIIAGIISLYAVDAYAETTQQNTAAQDPEITGTVTDANGTTLPGVNVIIQGTTGGTITDANGFYTIEAPANSILIFSYIGFTTQAIQIAPGSIILDVQLVVGMIELEKIVKIGYGTQKAKDLTGSITSVDIDEVINASDVSIMQVLQGSVAGLNIGQVDVAGEEPSISIRGRSSLSGEGDPLIVVDDIIYRGDIIDLNPSDIKTVDVLKDASATAIYGSQASNGVILVTTTRSGGKTGGTPEINFSSQYSMQRPWRELRAQSPEEFMQKIEHSDLEQSRLAPEYTQRNPAWAETTNFKTNHEIEAFNANLPFDWYSAATNENPYIMKSDLSIANSTGKSNYFTSVGYTRQEGHMKDEGYRRFNARINLSNSVTDWLKVDIQSFVTSSAYDPQTYSPADRFIEPYAHPYVVENGQLTDELEQRPFGNPINPLIEESADMEDKRLNLFGNISATIMLPLKGLSYKGNFANNYRTSHDYFYGDHGANFTGAGHKNEDKGYDWTSDHILTYDRNFNENHDVNVTLLYGAESRNYSFTEAAGENFVNGILGYNRLQAAAAELQSIESGGWQEASLYSMGRLVYAYKSKYLLTSTIRRDGFSGFSEDNKIGYFPSLSLGWVITDESFFPTPDWLYRIKLRASYGSTGNRTIGRYQTLAKVTGDMRYISASGSPLYAQYINAMASPNLKWETTTGIDVGIDFILFEGRISGAVSYYDKNTTDLLYNVDIPGMTGFETFPDNLGEIHNQGLEIELSTVNVQMGDLRWKTNFTFSRNRNEIVTLLGFDVDDDGVEDDLISEGLFIGESLSAIYDFTIDGLWQLEDENAGLIPAGYEFGSYKVVDLNEDGVIDPADDRIIIGDESPAYRFSINSSLDYKNWNFSFFINSIQGGKDRYLGRDNLYGLAIFNSETHFNRSFPAGLDYWTPENTGARYQRPGIAGSDGIAGDRWAPRSFVRLQNVRLSYDFDAAGLDRFGIKKLRLFFSGKNLITITKWEGWDPETGVRIDDSTRPVMRNFSFGINITL